MAIAGLALALAGGAGFAQGPAPLTYTITPLAGNGTPGFAGDGGSADAAQINNAWGMAFDSSWNLYVADQHNHRIRRIAPDGAISTAAGRGAPSFGGDNAAAINAGLNFPSGVAVAANGDLYIADTANHRIRLVSAGGIIVTVAGGESSGSTGDGAAATAAKLHYPTALFIEPTGRLLIADTYNHRIRAISPDGIISTIAGTGSAGAGGDGGPATSASLNYPQGVAADAQGRIYIADTFNHRIRRVETDGTITSIAGGRPMGFSGDNGPAVRAALFYPKGIALDSEGHLVIADCFNSRIRMVDGEGIIRTIAGNGLFGDRGDWGPAARARLRFPSAVAAAPSGQILVADTQNSRIRLLTPDIPIGDGQEIPTHTALESGPTPED